MRDQVVEALWPHLAPQGALASTAEGDLRAVVLRGPAGIGKSTPCQEVGSMARGQEWTSVTITAISDSGPYAPLADAVEHQLIRDRRLLDTVATRSGRC